MVYEKKNSQAASHLIDSFEKTKIRLTDVADKLKPCSNKKLAAEGYHRINFVDMDYFFLYRIDGDKVIVDNMFHFLQDYEHKME